MRPRMYGSTDMNVLRTTSRPSAGSATSVSASSKSDGWGSPFGREASRISRLVKGIPRHASPLDLDAVVVEDRAARHVGVALLDGGVDVGVPAHVLEPVALGGGDHAGADAVADLDVGLEAAAGVEDAGAVAGHQAARLRVLRMKLDLRAAGLPHQVRLVGEHRVQEPVAGGGDQRERVLSGLGGRDVAGQRVVTVVTRGLAEEL